MKVRVNREVLYTLIMSQKEGTMCSKNLGWVKLKRLKVKKKGIVTLGFSLDNWGGGEGRRHLYFLVKQNPDRKLHAQTEGALTLDLVCWRVDEQQVGALQREDKFLGKLVLHLFSPQLKAWHRSLSMSGGDCTESIHALLSRFLFPFQRPALG